MLTVNDFHSLGRGKSRGKLTFYAQADGQAYEISLKGKTVTFVYPVKLGDGFVECSIAIGQGLPRTPPVSVELVAYARQLARARELAK